MTNNKLLIAGAGSGKTTVIVNEALKQTGNVLITTFTEANEAEIKNKIIKIKKCIPSNITIQTWFSFLLQHGVRPYQGGIYNNKIKGLLLVNSQSVRFVPETNIKKHYFTDNNQIYSDKLSKFVIKCNEESKGEVINRLSRIYSTIFIDEIQDLAGYDLEVLKLLFNCSSNILMVGDPRQVTYLTHPSNKYSKYKNGLIEKFILDECEDNTCQIDKTSMNFSYRNNKFICDFSSKLYPDFNKLESKQTTHTDHDGIFLVKKPDINDYCNKYLPQELVYSKAENPAITFGNSKGLSFNRILIYPTKKIEKFLINNDVSEIDSIKAKFYVALTRAKYSVAIVYDYNDEENFDKIQKWSSVE